ncbi:hypothetical protein [Kitasatospora cinereorecta]|uniref:Uncharacterized protein n=1 Tax=Kitasatospora cinereorecta TaxID=285560 RepID=A0ABW0V920_9ACTN
MKLTRVFDGISIRPAEASQRAEMLAAGPLPRHPLMLLSLTSRTGTSLVACSRLRVGNSRITAGTSGLDLEDVRLDLIAR